jgi:hypothetical protein
MNELRPSLHESGYSRGGRIGLVLPNGPALALALIDLAQWAWCVPLSPHGRGGWAQSELVKDLEAARRRRYKT